MINQLAIVFPGQGSQKVGMLQELLQTYPQILTTFNEASEILGYDLWNIVQNGPEETLNQTQITQPALLVSSVAMWRLWQEQNPEKTPAFMAGHSLGEYTALVCADSIDFRAAVSLVQDRGRFMQEAFTGASAMVAIVGLDTELVKQICVQASQETNEILVPANYNSIGQIVLAGQFNAATKAAALAKAAGAKMAKILPVSVPSHCELMLPAAEKLKARLAGIAINIPKISVIHNADVAYYQEPDQIRDALVRQLYSPVRWVETIEFMTNYDVKTILECGPGKVLTGLNKRINSSIEANCIF